MYTSYISLWLKSLEAAMDWWSENWACQQAMVEVRHLTLIPNYSLTPLLGAVTKAAYHAGQICICVFACFTACIRVNAEE